MENTPLVSIITPSYNQGKFIEATIHSVLSQSYTNIEYIVVDGGSSDNTLQILSKYNDKIKWISEPDKGQSDAINKGFKMATGSIVAWLNSDDTYEPDSVSKAVQYMVEQPSIVLVYGDANIIDEHGEYVKKFEYTQPFDLWTLIHLHDYIVQPTTFFRKQILCEIGYLNISLNWCMDWDLWIRLAQKGGVAYIPQVLANSREYGETKTSTGGWRRLKEITRLMKNYGNMKYPYGIYIYAASTLYQNYKRSVILEKSLGKILYYIQSFVMKRLPIRYLDGWVGKTYEFTLNHNISTLYIDGEVVFKETVPQKMKVYDNNSLIKTFQITNTGSFSLRLELVQTQMMNHFVKIKFSKVISPRQIDTSNHDKRRLSILVKKINPIYEVHDG